MATKLDKTETPAARRRRYQWHLCKLINEVPDLGEAVEVQVQSIWPDTLALNVVDQRSGGELVRIYIVTPGGIKPPGGLESLGVNAGRPRGRE